MTRIATWNVNSLKVRLPHVLQWLDSNKPDILVLQETKLPQENFPYDAIEEAGYHAIYNGQKTYNGVAILSLTEAQTIITDLPGYDDPQRRLIGATFGDLRVLNLYIPNGASVGSDKYAYKLEWLSHLHALLKKEMATHQRLVILGDFNIAPEDRDVHDPQAWEGSVLVSPKEREILQSLMALGFIDAFRLFDQPEKSYSWWDYRAGGFRRNHGLRIDLILISEALRSDCRGCTIDREPRTWERPSDHTPVCIELK